MVFHFILYDPIIIHSIVNMFVRYIQFGSCDFGLKCIIIRLTMYNIQSIISSSAEKPTQPTQIKCNR